MRTSRTLVRLVGAAVAVLSLAGCATREPTPTAGTRSAPAPAATVVATARGATLPVYAAPGAAHPLRRLSARTGYGSPRVVDVVGARGQWLAVMLPARAPHDRAWVRRADVSLSRTSYRVVVSLSARRLTLYDGARALLRRPVAVGAAATPTPRGRFFVTDVVRVPAGQRSYGPFALGLSGYSPTLREFAGGDAQVALHGTDHPELLGLAVSHGCVRIGNDTISELATVLPLGTPVDVVA